MTRRTGADATGRTEPPGEVPRPRSVAISGSVRSAAALAALLLVGGCAERVTTFPETSPAPSSTVTVPDGGTALVLRVEHVGGFMPAQWTYGRLPISSLYADGRLITEGPMPASYPGPALPNVQVQELDAATVQEAADRAVAAGIAERGDLGSPPIADAPSTRFTLGTAEGVVTRDVYALSEFDGEDVGLTEEQVADRARLRELLTFLSDLGQRPSPDGRAAVEPYVPEAVAAISAPWTDPDDRLDHPERPWPGPALPGAPIGALPGVGCLTATGDEATAVLAAAEDANALTPWLSADGVRWSVLFRPLLPDESSCADLTD
jgi:hypothetical protein